MSNGSCINCGHSDAEPCELLVRHTSHERVLLCGTCREAIEREIAEEG